MANENPNLTQGQQPVVVRARRPIAYLGTGVLLVGFAVGIVYLYVRPAPPQSTGNGYVSLPPTEPWSYARDVLPEKPTEPTRQQLIDLFQQARTAMNTTSNVDGVLSSQLVWQATHHVVSSGEKKDGLLVNTAETRDPKDFFQNILGTLPIVDKITYGGLAVSSGADTTQEQGFYIKNEKTGELQKFIVTPWRYWATLSALAKDSDGENIQGEIRFVYDRGVWKYHFEYWERQE